MRDQNPVYDVAISFLYQDVDLAQAIYEELSKGLKVFFYPRNQEELAGSDGLESMRAPFRSQSLLNLVLYRPQWGNTPWTGVEAIAIKDSCLETTFKSIFFVVIEPTFEIPAWLPETHVRFNFADFTLEQAIGAIKARVQERGGHFKPMTPSRKVALLQIEEEYQRERGRINSEEGITKIYENVRLLFSKIVTQIEDVNTKGHINIEHRIQLQFGAMEQSCLLGMNRLGMVISWFQRYPNMLEPYSSLIVREFNENTIILPGRIRLQEPDVLKEEKYVPDISRARECVWRPKKGNGELVSSQDLAPRLVLQFLDLVEQDRAGKIKRKGLQWD